MTEYEDTLRKICFCGHHQVSHHEGKDNCLGMYCDCRFYLNEWAAKDDPARTRKPVSIGADDEEECPDTPKMPWGFGGWLGPKSKP